jgi:hypothetical protein
MAKKGSQELQRLTGEIKSTPKEELPTFRLSILIEKANRGKANGPEVKELSKFLDEHPDLASGINLMAHSVKHTVMLKIVPEAGHLELFEREYDRRRDELGWKDASTIERLMIERIMLLWVRLLWCENYNAGYMKGGVVMSESEFADKQLARAHSRYVKAVESLAKLRQVQAITKAANAQASLLEMKEKTTRARIEAAHPGLLNGDRGLKAVLKRGFA